MVVSWKVLVSLVHIRVRHYLGKLGIKSPYCDVISCEVNRCWRTFSAVCLMRASRACSSAGSGLTAALRCVLANAGEKSNKHTHVTHCLRHWTPAVGLWTDTLPAMRGADVTGLTGRVCLSRSMSLWWSVILKRSWEVTWSELHSVG